MADNDSATSASLIRNATSNDSEAKPIQPSVGRSDVGRYQKSWRCKSEKDVLEGQLHVTPHEERLETHKKIFKHFVYPHDGGVTEYMTKFFFRNSYTVALVGFVGFYVLFDVLFGLILFAVNDAYARSGRECMSGWDYTVTGRDSLRVNREISFALSWQTFSTVGYGTISPPDEAGCAGIRWLLGIHAFLGVLFAGFCGAIFYSKVSKANSIAPVVFSSPVCLQYGQGITVPNMVNSQEEMKPQEGEEMAKNKFPFLEFRFAHAEAKFRDHELLDVSIRCTALGFRLNEENEVQTFFEEINVSPSYLPYFGSIWKFRHTLDADSPVLRASVRKRLTELGEWPSDLDDHASIRNSLTPYLFEIYVSVAGTSNLTAESVFKRHVYKPEDIYIGWRFASPFRDVQKIKRLEMTNLGHVLKLDRIHDIVPQRGGGNEPPELKPVNNDVMSFIREL